MPEDKDFVEKDECLQHVTEIENKLQMILSALRGPDLRGGLVKDVNKLYTELALLKKSVDNGYHNAEWSRKQWLAIGTAIGSPALSFLGTLILHYLGIA